MKPTQNYQNPIVMEHRQFWHLVPASESPLLNACWSLSPCHLMTSEPVHSSMENTTRSDIDQSGVSKLY